MRATGPLLALASTLLLARGASAATYYVSPQGDDAAGGASASAPMLTLEAASRRLAAGDTLLLRRGGAWLDEAVVGAAAGLTVGAYGDAAAPQPLIQHGRTLNGVRACATFTQADGLTVRDLHLSGCSGGLQIGGPASGANATNVLVELAMGGRWSH